MYNFIKVNSSTISFNELIILDNKTYNIYVPELIDLETQSFLEKNIDKIKEYLNNNFLKTKLSIDINDLHELNLKTIFNLLSKSFYALQENNSLSYFWKSNNKKITGLELENICCYDKEFKIIINNLNYNKSKTCFDSLKDLILNKYNIVKL